MSRGETNGRGLKNVSPTVVAGSRQAKKILKNLLTNTTKCVIIKTLREGKQPERKGSPREQVRLSRQRLSLARCVGLRVINVSQSPKAEAMWDYADYKAKSKWASRLSSPSYGAKLNEGFESSHAYQFLLNTSFLSEAFDCGQGLSAHSVSRSRMALASGILVI